MDISTVQSPWLSNGSSSHSIKPLSTPTDNAPRSNYNNRNVSSLPHSIPDQSFSNNGLSSSIPIHTQGSTTQSCMEDVEHGKENTSLESSARLPSPVSDDDNDTNMESVASGDAEMPFYSQSPKCSPVPGCTQSISFLKPTLCHPSRSQDSDATTYCNPMPARKKPTLVMGYRADCDKCRRQVPGHYSHIIQ